MPLGILVEKSKTPASLVVYAQAVKALLVLTTTVASVTPPGICEGAVQTIYKEEALDCHLQ